MSGSLSVAMGVGLTHLRASGGGTPTPTPTPTPTGFVANGSGSTWKAALAQVAAGTARARLAIVENSTGVGAGGPVVSGTAADVRQELVGARPYRTAAVMASLASAAGFPALDNGIVGDGYVSGFGSPAVTPLEYDPRLSYFDNSSTAWVPSGGLTFPGGNFLNPSGSSRILQMTLASVSHFVVVAFNVGGTIGFAVDGATASGITAPGASVSGNNVTMPSSNDGFTTITIPAGSAGTHTLGLYAPGTPTPLVQSIRGYNNAVAAIDIMVFAACGATTAQLASTNSNHWLALDALKHFAPHLTIIGPGINDMGNGVSVSSFTTSAQAIIDGAKVSGDGLLMAPWAINPTSASQTVQDDYHAAFPTIAAGKSVASADARSQLGTWAATSSRYTNGINHGNRGLYADLGAYYWACAQAMAA